MAVDMKETIAKATVTLLMEKRVKKLTVKDIVEECHITRQTFYYHFEDVPDLLHWMMEKGMDHSLERIRSQDGAEAGLRYFLLMSLNALPYFKKAVAPSYEQEMERCIKQQTYRIFERLVQENGLYRDCTRTQLDLILRYHILAILGLLRDWTEEDSRNIDAIVHEIYLLLTGGVTPFSRKE